MGTFHSDESTSCMRDEESNVCCDTCGVIRTSRLVGKVLFRIVGYQIKMLLLVLDFLFLATDRTILLTYGVFGYDQHE